MGSDCEMFDGEVNHKEGTCEVDAKTLNAMMKLDLSSTYGRFGDDSSQSCNDELSILHRYGLKLKQQRGLK
jgi:hypothetical protein